MSQLHFNSLELKTLAAASWFVDNGADVSLNDHEKKFSFDSSFTLEERSFDVGYHAIDIGRNEMWDQILSALPIKWRRTEGSRALVSFGKVLPRFYSQSELGKRFDVVDLNQHTDPHLRKLEKCFGTAFVNYVQSEIVPSYAQNKIWEDRGFPREEVLKNIYPWFFPAGSGLDDLPTHFHDVERPLGVRYPDSDSFGSISKALKSELQRNIAPSSSPLLLSGEHLDAEGRILLPLPDADVFVTSIDYWSVAEKLGLPMPNSIQTHFYLTSIVASNHLDMRFNEYLVGERQYRFDRISSPDFLRGADDFRAIQFETELLNPTDTAELTDEVVSFAKKQFGLKSTGAVDVKHVKIKRFADADIVEKTAEIIQAIERKNPGFIVANRSLGFQNLSDGVPQLISTIQDQLNDKK